MIWTQATAWLIKKSVLFQGYHRVSEFHFGAKSQRDGKDFVLDREVFDCGNHACVLPYDPRRDEVVLIRQFRAGAYVAGMPPWTWEMVGGIVGEGESAEAVVRREAMEESGLTLKALMPLYKAMACPGAVTEIRTMFLGLADTREAGGFFGLESEGEDIFADVVSLATARTMLKRGDIVDLTCIAALQWLLLNRDEVQASWG